jgi:hypothetical protein
VTVKGKVYHWPINGFTPEGGSVDPARFVATLNYLIEKN